MGPTTRTYALGAKDGKLAWKARTNGYEHGKPAVVEGGVI